MDGGRRIYSHYTLMATLEETRYSGLTREKSTTVDSRIEEASLITLEYVYTVTLQCLDLRQCLYSGLLLLNKHTSNIKYVETISGTSLCLRVLNEFHSSPFQHLQF